MDRLAPVSDRTGPFRGIEPLKSTAPESIVDNSGQDRCYWAKENAPGNSRSVSIKGFVVGGDGRIRTAE